MKLSLVDLAGHFRVKINGFPVEEPATMVRMSRSDVTARLNTALIGKGNEASVSIMPFVRVSGETLSIGTVKVRAKVLQGERLVEGAEIKETYVDSTYRAWTKQAQGQWKSYLSRIDPGTALDSMRIWTRRNPLMVSTTFDNEAGPDFSRIFEEAPVIEDTSRLKDYAMHLRDLMAKNDTSALFEEFRFYYAQQYKITGYDGGVEVDKASLRENVVMADPELNFTRTDVGLRRWSGGRIWEVYREGADAFFQSGSTVREVYVAEIDGDLKVVR